MKNQSSSFDTTLLKSLNGNLHNQFPRSPSFSTFICILFSASTRESEKNTAGSFERGYSDTCRLECDFAAFASRDHVKVFFRSAASRARGLHICAAESANKVALPLARRLFFVLNRNHALGKTYRKSGVCPTL